MSRFSAGKSKVKIVSRFFKNRSAGFFNQQVFRAGKYFDEQETSRKNQNVKIRQQEIDRKIF